jgi:hypothetical protein
MIQMVIDVVGSQQQSFEDSRIGGSALAKHVIVLYAKVLGDASQSKNNLEPSH